MHRLILFILPVLFLSKVSADPWQGTDYAKNSSVQLSHAERFLMHLSLQGDEQILDIGCGDGKITALFAQKVPHGLVVGIDPSASMLAKAEEIRKQQDLPNLLFYEQSAESFSFNEQFDHIIAIHVMHWIKDQKQALKNMYAHLKPQGHIHFILAPSKEGLPFDRALQKTVLAWGENFNGFVNSQQVFDMETYRKFMVDAGFHIKAIHYVYHESIHENKDKLKTWVKQWLPHGKFLPAAKQDAFLTELTHHYLNEMGISQETSDPVLWGEYVLIVEASKK